MKYLRTGVASLSLLTIVLPVVAMSAGESMKERAERDFCSLTEEQQFWTDWQKEWRKQHDDRDCPLQPFLRERQRYLWRQVNDKLDTVKTHELFVIIVRTNVDNGILDAVCLTKDSRWRSIRWDLTGRTLEESVGDVASIREDIIGNLAAATLFVDLSDWSDRTQVIDATTAYVFLKYKNKCSRFAIYHPKHCTAVGSPETNLSDALSYLFRIVGLDNSEDK